jgi:hypothetical protein
LSVSRLQIAQRIALWQTEANDSGRTIITTLLPATRRRFVRATPFGNVAVTEPLLKAGPVTLETFLGNQL